MTSSMWLLAWLLPVAAQTEEPRIAINVAARLPQLATALNKDEVPVARKLALGRAATGSADAEETRIALAEALREASEILATPLHEPVSVATLVDGREDILVARWQPPISDDVMPVLLWDDSISWTVIFRCNRRLLQSPDELRPLIDGLLNWSTYRLGTTGFCIRRPAGPGLSLVGYGYRSSRRIPSPFDDGPHITFAGIVENSSGYLAITSKSIFGKLKHVDERFPPLGQRALEWATQRLLEEIGKSRRARYLVFGQYKRDGILLRELAGRTDFTIAAFRDRLFRGVGNRPSMAGDVLPEMIRAAIDAGTITRFAAVVDEFLDPARSKFAMTFPADFVYQALSEHSEIDVEQRAIQYLRDPRTKHSMIGCLKYLQQRGKTAAARDAVQAVDAEGWYREKRKAALDAIGARLR